MVNYKFKAKEEFLKNAGGSIDIITEGRAILGILTDERKFPKTKRNIIEYAIDVKNSEIRFELRNGLDKNIYNLLKNYWEIEEE